MKFDELHKLFTRYFEVMEIPKEDKKKRVDLALEFYDIFLYILLLIKTDLKYDRLEEPQGYMESLNYRIQDMLGDLPYEEEYIPQLSKDVIETTFRHLDDEYYFSEDRTILISQNEANTVMNNIDYVSAKRSGKTRKTWVTELDNRTREWHVVMNNVEIPIDDYFVVGDDLMKYPHDYHASPENVINCRCTCFYS